MSAVVVLTTVGASFNAKHMARDLVQRRLCACVNVLPAVESIYMWEGKLTEDAEQLLVMKTTAACLDELRDAVFSQHPYDVPEFVVINIDDIRGPYGDWLLGAVS